MWILSKSIFLFMQGKMKDLRKISIFFLLVRYWLLLVCLPRWAWVGPSCSWTCAVYRKKGSVLPVVSFIWSLRLVCGMRECFFKTYFTFREVTKTWLLQKCLKFKVHFNITDFFLYRSLGEERVCFIILK